MALDVGTLGISKLAPPRIATISLILITAFVVVGPLSSLNIVDTWRGVYIEQRASGLVTEESSLLQLSESVVRKTLARQVTSAPSANITQLISVAITSPRHGLCSLVQMIVQIPGESALNVVVIVILLLVTFAAVMFIDNSRFGSESLQNQPTFSGKGSRPNDQERAVAPSTPLSKPRVLSDRSSPARSGRSSTIAEPRVSPGQRITLAVPSLLAAPSDELKQSNFQVTDLTSKTLLNVTVMVPPRDVLQMEQFPHEYVTLYSTDGEDELAMCALGPQGVGQYWRCDIYQRGDTLFGHIIQDKPRAQSSSVNFSLMDVHKERLLSIAVELGGLSPRGSKQRRITVFDESGNKCAEIQPGAFSFGHKGQYYQADCLPDADLGIIVIALMAIDRLLTHRHPTS